MQLRLCDVAREGADEHLPTFGGPDLAATFDVASAAAPAALATSASPRVAALAAAPRVRALAAAFGFTLRILGLGPLDQNWKLGILSDLVFFVQDVDRILGRLACLVIDECSNSAGLCVGGHDVDFIDLAVCGEDHRQFVAGAIWWQTADKKFVAISVHVHSGSRILVLRPRDLDGLLGSFPDLVNTVEHADGILRGLMLGVEEQRTSVVGLRIRRHEVDVQDLAISSENGLQLLRRDIGRQIADEEFKAVLRLRHGAGGGSVLSQR
mmetsp:Transcript_84402/g.272819  ORF Transcript_84402/g.272819 Transcript_84402/m.272819 type:complete len:267 (-) Transcript_84402:15-815(-)